MTVATKKRSDAAFAAAVQWAETCPLETLRYATNDRVAKSYGINSADASRIISKACKQRGLSNG